MRKFLAVLFIIFSALPLNAGMAQEILSWEDCLQEAKKNNPDLISASESIKEQKASKAITASGLFPQITSGVDGSTSMTTFSDDSGNKTRSTSDSYSYGASASQLIFDGLSTINDVRAKTETVKAAQEGYRFVSSEVRYNLRSAFINLMRAQEFIKVSQEILKIRKENLELLSLRYLSGLEHKGALLTAEANLAEADSELFRAERDVGIAQRQMTKALGRSEFKPVYVKVDFTVVDKAEDKPDFEEIVKNNPSVLQASAQKNASMFGIKSAYGNFFPQITGTAGVDKSGSHWPPGNDGWNLGLSLNLPIFEGGLRNAQVSQAKAIYEQSNQNQRSIRDTALVNLEQAWAVLKDALDSVEVQRKTLEATEERSRIAEAQYSTGFIAFDNWIIIEDDLVSAKKNYLNAQASALLAEANWIQAKGETLEYAQ